MIGNYKFRIKKMKKTILLLLIFMSVNLSLISQNLVWEQDFSSSGICPSPGSEACVTIIANRLLELTFETNVDTVVTIALKRAVGQNFEYTIHFPTDRPEYFDRTLTIYCQSFAKGIQIPLLLAPKESELYYVSVTECYKTHLEKGLTLFKSCSYADAREEFRKAMEECSDVPPNDDVKTKISVIDSIQRLRKLAKESFEMLDYKKAEEYFFAIHSLNREDNFAYQRLLDCQAENRKYCELYMINAKKYFDGKEFEKAEILYNKVIENGCHTDNIELATFYLGRTDKKLGRKKGDPMGTAFTFQWAYYKQLGFSVGGYDNKKVSAYFTFLYNLDPIMVPTVKGGIDTLVRTLDFKGALGLTVRPVRNKYVPIWLTIGAGYAGLIHSVSPEIGILIKIPFGVEARAGIALSYTFQYRIPIEVETRNLVRKPNHLLGFGFCF